MLEAEEAPTQWEISQGTDGVHQVLFCGTKEGLWVAKGCVAGEVQESCGRLRPTVGTGREGSSLLGCSEPLLLTRQLGGLGVLSKCSRGQVRLRTHISESFQIRVRS